MSTGHIRERIGKNGAISYQLTAESEKDPITGQRRRTYATVKGSKKQAEAKLRKMITELESGGIVKPSIMKLSDWLTTWLTTYLPNIEQTTRAGYQERINSCINPVLGSIPLSTLSTYHIQNWVNELQSARKLSPKTIKNAFLIMNAALRKAALLQMIQRNPCDGVELPKLVKYQGEVLDSGEIAQVIDAARGTDMFLIVLLAVYVGFRRGELIALQWSDIDFQNNVIHIRHNTTMVNGEKISKAPKTAAGIRDVSISESVKQALMTSHTQYLTNKLKWGAAFKNSNLVICKENGEGYRPDSITQKWERFVQSKQLKPVRLHDLRHPYVKHTTKNFILRLMVLLGYHQALYSDAPRKRRGAYQHLQEAERQICLRLCGNSTQFSS